MPPTGEARPSGFVHPSTQHAKKKPPPSPFVIKPITAFFIFLGANLISALFAPIQDCDETFNYWEPAHYLSHHYGLQTWEYSPDYAIRSWFYIALHAIVGSFRRLLPFPTKVAEFYFVRYSLAVICAFCQVLLFRVVSFTLHPRIGLFFLMAVVMSPGNFNASTAFLPSSFAMYTSFLGAAAFMNWRGGIKTSWGIWWFAVGGILGWPFASALSFPFMAEEAIFAFVSDRERLFESALRVARGVIAGLILILGDVAINAFFYRKVEVVSWNIVKYNIFSSTGGPDLYGTEPWTYYFRNLAINFNIWFVLALLSLPLFIAQKIFTAKQRFQSGLRMIVFLSPFYMWLGIFTLQPHKEERFMYPAYPFVALNAAIGMHIVLSAFGNADPKTLIGKIPGKLKFFVVAAVLLVSLDLGVTRIIGLYTGYSAPFKIYQPLGAGLSDEKGLGGQGDTVCFGKEWYRFPTSYFLPRDMHAKFVRSEFRGLLPGEFSEARTGFGVFSGTWLPTSGVNDQNKEDMAKYVDIRHCSFLVDTQYPESTETPPEFEPDYIANTDDWEVVKCEPFLDAGRTHFLSRVLWMPDSELVPLKYRRKWGKHCLLQRKAKETKP
ncbi:Alg9-like mannosyltransferase [Xylariaceae sp. FL0255]|nr:Alg9-like mannosyltransferase [Xylariaceae sp. FL0255]